MQILLQLRSIVSPLSENSKFSTSQLFQPLLVCHRGLLSRYNSKWDRERRESLHSVLVLENFNQLWQFFTLIMNFWMKINFLKKMTPPMAFVMELRSNYHGRRVLNSYVGRKLVTNYRNVTKLLRDESTLPWYYKTPVAQTLLLIDDDVERWLWKKGMK